MKHVIPRTNFVLAIAATVLWAGLATARADDQQERTVVVTTQTQSDDDDRPVPAPLPAPAPAPQPAPPGTSATVRGPDLNVTIQAVEPDDKRKQAKEVTWLGLAVEESTEVLSSQLGLKTGEGLTVNFIAAGSPAAKADFHKNDVLVELDGQMLVHPLQLRKLVQMHAEGDAVNVTFYRGGKKQTASVKLGKTTWEEASDMEEKPTSDPFQNFQNLKFQLKGLDGQLHGMSESLARAGLDKAKMNIEVKRTMEQTRKAIQDAMRHASKDREDAMRRVSKDRKSLSDVDRELQALAGAGVDVDKDATVIVRNNHNSIKTIVESDENGSYIVEAGAHKHLTAHDKNGKLLFDGEIDTPAEQEKVPKEVWEKAKAMLDQIAEPMGSEPKAEDKAGEKPDS